MVTTQTETASQTPIEQILQRYGDILFDFCESILWSSTNAQVAFRSIIREVRKKQAKNPFANYERAWIFRIACEKLRSMAQRHSRRLTPSEQIMLDASLNVPARFKQFDSYFHRLPTEDQMLLLLRDKYGLPYPEIAAAMATPEGSLKIRRQQALRMLEEWLWEQV